ncbi:MAG TPA: hypothetical protein PLO37_09305 [Candidatus Hydrogenedentes bacterium]|nr:hypothetical protein [Candidatus Hydrogenedentota bacterium]HPG67027.1 hypothetical protein [Candidatus Hydrogenedentota bacterium]
MDRGTCLIALTVAAMGWASLAEEIAMQDQDAAMDTAPSLAPDLPDAEIVTAYEKAASQNVLAAVNPEIFPGYWSVCADGIGFGRGNTYPSLDGHQMADALLWLGQVDVVKANWAYVRSFQRPDGRLPLAILPAAAGQPIGPQGCQADVDPNGGLYKHWVPGDPLRALAAPTYIQNADILYRRTQDRDWLAAQLPSVNLATDSLAAITTPDGAVGGAGYYLERPTRVEYDGVAQGYAVDAFRRVAALNAVLGNAEAVARYRELAGRVETHFRNRFWTGDRFAEYIHPERGPIASHGFTDADWAAIATGVATPAQESDLWPLIKDETRFCYGGMPTGIATHPEAYERWEFTYDDRMDLAAMGRVWYLECWARARMGDGHGLVESIRRVCATGRKNGYYWRERYNADGGYGAEKYCEYPANLIRIVQRFVLGVEFELDGTLTLAPTAPADFWRAGFGQTLQWRGRRLAYRMSHGGIEGEYAGPSDQRLRVRLDGPPREDSLRIEADGVPVSSAIENGRIAFTLPAAADTPCRFRLAH